MAKKGKTPVREAAVAEAIAEVTAKDNRSEERKTVVTNADGTMKYKCQYCGKFVSFDSWSEFEAGDYCHQIRDEQGWSEASLMEHRKAMSSDQVPVTDDGREYIKIANLGRVCRKEGIPISRLVRAFGGDRTLNGALHPKFEPIYVGKARYVHPDCGTKWGLDFMRAMSGGRSNGTAEAAIEAALS